MKKPDEMTRGELIKLVDDLYWSQGHYQEEIDRLTNENALLRAGQSSARAGDGGLAERDHHAAQSVTRLRRAQNTGYAPLLLENPQGDVIGAVLPGEGLFYTAATASEFAKLTNDLSAIAAGILNTALQGSGAWRAEYLKMQQGELAAAYLRFCNFLIRTGDDPHGAPGYVDLETFIKQAEAGIYRALNANDFSALHELARTGTDVITRTNRALAGISQRRRGSENVTIWLAEVVHAIRDDYLRSRRKPQAWRLTLEDTLRHLRADIGDDPPAGWQAELLRELESWHNQNQMRPFKDRASQAIKRARS